MPIRATRKDTRPDEYLGDIPNRSIDEEEYQAYTPEQRQAIRDSGLWTVKTDREMQPTRAVEPTGKEG